MSIAEEYYKAGQIASDVRRRICQTARPGMKVLDLCNMVEDEIRSRGAEPAFPCNVSIDEVAAHYTAEIDDSLTIKDGNVVKIDLGAHISGYLVDTAATITFNPDYNGLVRATEEALNEAIKLARVNVRTGDLGEAISNTAARYGYRPITNLSGHSIESYRVHAGISIPNTWMGGTPSLKAGGVYAIEPFLTTEDGAGQVIDGPTREIYSLVGRKRTHDKSLDELLEHIWSSYRTLPFATRYLEGKMEKTELKQALTKLVTFKALRSYPSLIEANGRIVAQFEHTIAPEEGRTTVLTV